MTEVWCACVDMYVFAYVVHLCSPVMYSIFKINC